VTVYGCLPDGSFFRELSLIDINIIIFQHPPETLKVTELFFIYIFMSPIYSLVIKYQKMLNFKANKIDLILKIYHY
jgi:hypothetical protein